MQDEDSNHMRKLIYSCVRNISCQVCPQNKQSEKGGCQNTRLSLLLSQVTIFSTGVVRCHTWEIETPQQQRVLFSDNTLYPH